MVTSKYTEAASAAKSVWRDEMHRSPAKRLRAKLALKKSADVALELVKKYSAKNLKRPESSAQGKSRLDASFHVARGEQVLLLDESVGTEAVESLQPDVLNSSVMQRICLVSHQELNPRRKMILSDIYTEEFNWYSVREQEKEVCDSILNEGGGAKKQGVRRNRKSSRL